MPDNASDTAGLIESAYKRSNVRDEFCEIMKGYPWILVDPEVLFVLCNAMWSAGYDEALGDCESGQ